MEYLEEKINSLTDDQKDLFDQMQLNNLLQICIPTGAGKGYLMMIHLLNQILNKNSIDVISSHRLMLNTQHFNDLFDILSPFLGDVGFIFMGSSSLTKSIKKYQENKKFNTILKNKGLSWNDIISSTISTKTLKSSIKKHKENNRKIVILTTYHSLFKLENIDINTIYNDEAHILASETIDSKFQENFDKISYKKCYFFTATPKDCVEETSLFLMNNEEKFGKRIGLSFKECIDEGYLPKPVIHIAYPKNFDSNKNFDSIKNGVKFVKSIFKSHNKFIKKNSYNKKLINSRLLIKCPSVDKMWELHEELINKINKNIIVCAGASRSPYNDDHFIGEEGIKDRSDYLEQIENINSKIVVLHYDTMSEGINLGFTATMFFNDILPTISKTLQNIGRSTRLDKHDRNRLRKGEIDTQDRSKWIKPYSSVILPIWDTSSQFVSKELASKVKSLRDEFGFDPNFYVSVGSDISKSVGSDPLDEQNLINKKKKKFELIDKIKHEIEILDKEEYDIKESIRLNKLSKIELLKEKLGQV